MAGIALGDRLRISAILTAHQLRALAAAAYSSPLYRWRLSGGASDRLLIAPQDLRTADPTMAIDIYHGRFSLAGSVAETAGESPFALKPPNVEWHRALHGFGWLRDLRAADTELARIQARALISDWMSLYGSWDAGVWDPVVTARRLISWFSHSPLVLKGADHAFYRRFMRSISRQTRHLARAGSEAPDGAPKLLAAIALCYAGLCMHNRQRLLRQASRWLADELARQILPDGGHISRNPEVLIDLLLDLLPLRQTFAARDVAPPPALTSAIDRMMPMLRFFRHGDGTLAHFNGMGPTYPDVMATLLAYDDARGRPVSGAPHSGYQRIEAGDVVVLIDTGPPPPPRLSREAHAGCLSFEMSAGLERIIVNCGVPPFGSRRWRTVSRSTAAHSTATLDDTSSCRFASAAIVVDRLGPIILSGPRHVPVERRDEEIVSVVASHDGYRGDFGIQHERRLTVSADGDRIEGEDIFSAIGGRATADPTYAVRFHLHPQVRASRTRDGTHVVLALPSGSAWEFFAGGAEISIEESVYLGGVEGPRRSEQIVVHGRCRHVPRVSWRLRRIERQTRRRRDSAPGEDELPFGAPETDAQDVAPSESGTGELAG
ncbi:putative heparinase superfamily protein [Tepidamorphus gemmatus]|uniref:Putative heparinase superfamily protein n=1 Tax=Tepidamorphus gemmatus TaxID=747076 RepID=A0A4V2UZN2_9HYPH|nr:heparinase II/III family protein [Tepidamorphus gemmatus]TCT11788.1 putative heparinase superfamily protein [Tepidamorphus gemmatus]